MPHRLTIICGAYGSGKTEFAIAYALKLKENSTAPVGLVDLDIVNPYFRSRDITEELGKQGLTVISTEPGLEYSDMPALSPRIFATLQDRRYQVVFDVGGDPAGARALGRFNRYFVEESYNLWIVINPFRPDTRTTEATIGMIQRLQEAGRLRASGIISNINLGSETDWELWNKGLQQVTKVADAVQLPIVYQAVEAGFLEAHRPRLDAYPVFPLHLKMLVPWA